MNDQSRKQIAFYNDPTIELVDQSSWDKAKLTETKLKSLIAAILKISEQEITLDRPKDISHGEYSANIALKLAPQLGKPPLLAAEEIMDKLKASAELREFVDKVEVAGPGFINFYLKESFLAESVLDVLKDGDKFGNNKVLTGKRIMFEYAHPNPFKSFHIGHLRNIVLGESLIRILEAHDAKVIRVNYQGDVGMHIAKCLWAFSQVDKRDYPNSINERVALISKCYIQGAKAYEEPELKKEIVAVNKKIYSRTDAEINHLWELGKQWSLDKFHQLYERVYSSFEREYMESETLELCRKFIKEAEDRKILEKSEGAVIFKGDKFGLETHVFLNSEGLPTYEGKELGLAQMEFHDYGNIDLCIHNVAVEQIGFFKVTFKVEELLDPKLFKGKQYHNAYEFVGLKSGKMSSRTGNVILAENILDQAITGIKEIIKDRDTINEEERADVSTIVGVGAVKYSFLNISAYTYLAFDLESSLNFEGNSGPYLQYTFARANRIMIDAGGEFDVNKLPRLDLLLKEDDEKALMRMFYRYPEVVIDAGKSLSPHLICNYLFELAQKFNLFYRNRPILREENSEVRLCRLAVTKATAQVMQNGLTLLGIKTVDRM